MRVCYFHVSGAVAKIWGCFSPFRAYWYQFMSKKMVKLSVIKGFQSTGTYPVYLD